MTFTFYLICNTNIINGNNQLTIEIHTFNTDNQLDIDILGINNTSTKQDIYQACYNYVQDLGNNSFKDLPFLVINSDQFTLLQNFEK